MVEVTSASVWNGKQFIVFRNIVSALLYEKAFGVLPCDASPWAVGAVLSYVMKDGREASIAYHSKTLDKTARRYIQLDREALNRVEEVP